MTEAIEVERTIAASRDQLWAYLSDPGHLALLNPDSDGATDVAPQGTLRQGQRWREVMHTPVGHQDVQTVVTSLDDPGGCIQLESTGPAGIRVKAEIRLRPEGTTSTLVTFTNRFALTSGGLFAALAESFLRSRMREASQIALDRLEAAVRQN